MSDSFVSAPSTESQFERPPHWLPALKQTWPEPAQHRPSILRWLRCYAFNIPLLVATGLLGIQLRRIVNPRDRPVPRSYIDGSIPTLSYPLYPEGVPMWAEALFIVLTTGFVYGIMALFMRSFWDLNNAIIGTLTAVVVGGIFQLNVKWLIGGLRPNFLSICNPAIPPPGASHKLAPRTDMYMVSDLCHPTNQDMYVDAQQSFPSGHTTTAFASMLFLSMYLHGKLGSRWATPAGPSRPAAAQPPFWYWVVLSVPLLAACLIAGAMWISQWHHWWELLAGGVIGALAGYMVYRGMYQRGIDGVRGVPIVPRAAGGGKAARPVD
ncbi:hypothetical protein EJ06DRAFT_585520 [Trichodelitschia bisporula]|uniref:Phosphatidic acid phosphatase type 2/haloperoxidase domain-containing protein n=1 Tax=Trichodelitschia bisporula TaxID=703511 RepID=A0A6G1HIT3_9PEZI|nr:hypothetical protein EJ06DRAFT_585520 [Trichodelitschia bisporula]